MSMIDSFMISIYGMTVVMSVLIFLCLVVNIQSLFFRLVNKYGGDISKQSKNYEVNTLDPNEDSGLTYGEMKLVDEKTAAMIMAIISDESKIPLSELQFKSIRVV